MVFFSAREKEVLGELSCVKEKVLVAAAAVQCKKVLLCRRRDSKTTKLWQRIKELNRLLVNWWNYSL